MTLAELRVLLESLNIPVKYRAFKVGQAPVLPYLLFYVIDNDGTLKADNHNFSKVSNVTIELYTEEKDVALEEQLEDVFDDYKIEYELFESYLETENMYEVAYDIRI